MVRTSGPHRHFPVYGGPQSGGLGRVKRGETRYSKFDASNRNAPRYWYVLVSAPDGGNAFVPEDDNGLRQAYLSASGDPGDRGAVTLAAEIRRRNLDF